MAIYLTIAFRIVTIMLFLLFSSIIISGRRTIGQLPVYDMLTIIVIGAITGADIAEPDVAHLHIIFAIAVTFLFQRFINFLNLRFKLARKMTSFPPIILIQDGKFIYMNLKKVRYSIDEVLMLLRQNDVFDLQEVQYAILEPNGELSILRNSSYQFYTRGDAKCTSEGMTLQHTVVMDGKIVAKNMAHVGITMNDLEKHIRKEGYKSIKDVFHASINEKGQINISPYVVKSHEI